MTDESPEDSAGARMQLDPDAIHEDDEGYALDCPECGSHVSLIQIVEEGRCDGYLEGDDAEAVDDDGGQQLEEPKCTAELALELVWQ